jgi:hypothetical protein
LGPERGWGGRRDSRRECGERRDSVGCKNKFHPPRTQKNGVNDKRTGRHEAIKTFFSFAEIQRET